MGSCREALLQALWNSLALKERGSGELVSVHVVNSVVGFLVVEDGKMAKLRTLILTVVCLSGACGLANGSMLDFDHVATTNTFAFIPDGYAGFHWDSSCAVVVNKDMVNSAGPGVHWGAVSDSYVGEATGGQDLIMWVDPGHKFDFLSVYVTAAKFPEDVRITGYLGTTVVHQTDVSVQTYAPTFFQSNSFMGIDKLIFHPLSNPDHVVIDNLTYNNPAVVPVPGAVLLGALGLSFAGWRLKRKPS
jgi:hypothetical protein